MGAQSPGAAGAAGSPAALERRIGARDPSSLQHRPFSPLRTEGKLRRCSAGTVRSRSRAPGSGSRSSALPKVPRASGFCSSPRAHSPSRSAPRLLPERGRRGTGRPLPRCGLRALQRVGVRRAGTPPPQEPGNLCLGAD